MDILISPAITGAYDSPNELIIINPPDDLETSTKTSLEACQVSLPDWLTANLTYTNELLSNKGAILFRGFKIDSVEKFNRVSLCFDSDPVPYMFRSSPRYSLAENVYVSTTYPSSRTINMHSESSYSYAWGKKIMFGCIIPSDEAGETPIADNRRVLGRLSDELVNKFKDKGIIYQRLLSPHIGMPWQEVFQTSSPKEAIRICMENSIECHFKNDTDLLIQWKRPAFQTHPVTGEIIWFNHAYFFHKYSIYAEMGISHDDDLPDDLIASNTFFGDGTEITYKNYLEIKSAYEAEQVFFKWEKGDVLLLDNMLMAHGRNPYKGERKIIVAIMEPHS